MKENQNDRLFTLLRYSTAAATLLCDAVCHDCSSCISEISDLNRQALSDLTDAERSQAMNCFDGSAVDLQLLQAVTACVSRAFEAAMLLPSPEELPHLPPLADIVTANRSLAAFAEAWGTSPKTPPPYQRHLHANQSRGAYALLITNYCSTDRGARLFPLAQALANHRYTLEESCNLLVRSSACNTEPHCIR